MSQWDHIYNELLQRHNEINRIYKCLNIRKLPQEHTLNKHINDITSEYNKAIDLYEKHSASFTKEHNSQFITILQTLRDKLIKIFNHTNLNILVPPNCKTRIDINIQDPNYTDLSDNDEYEDIMAQSREACLKICSQTIPQKYSGDPLSLKSFLISIQLLQTMVEDANTDLLKTFILSKLEGKALEVIPSEPADIATIITALRNKIKPDDSKVIESRMMALNPNKMSPHVFTKQAEELAEALNRALILEGTTDEKANSMTIDKTISMCKAATRSTIVKSVLAATTFQTPKNVLAKFITESTNEPKDTQILSYRATKFTPRRGFTNQRHYPNNQYYSYKKFQSKHNNFTYRNPSTNTIYRPTNRGRYSRNYSRGYRNYNNTNTASAHVRYLEAGNGEGPQNQALVRYLGEPSTSNTI